MPKKINDNPFVNEKEMRSRLTKLIIEFNKDRGGTLSNHMSCQKEERNSGLRTVKRKYTPDLHSLQIASYRCFNLNNPRVFPWRGSSHIVEKGSQSARTAYMLVKRMVRLGPRDTRENI